MSVSFDRSRTQKFHEVEKAKEWEAYRNLPKYTHVPYAVIHPSPKKLKKQDPKEIPDLTLNAS